MPVKDVFSVRIESHAAAHRVPRSQVEARITSRVVDRRGRRHAEERERAEVTIKAATDEGAAEISTPAAAGVGDQHRSRVSRTPHEWVPGGEMLIENAVN